MRDFGRRAALALAAVVALVGLGATAAPAAQASQDTGWPCGGACRVAR